MGAWSAFEKRAAALMAATILLWLTDFLHHISPAIIGMGVGLFALLPRVGILDIEDMKRLNATRPPAENTAEKQRVRQQMLARNWHDDAISPELGSFCQKSHLIAGLIDLS